MLHDKTDHVAIHKGESTKTSEDSDVKVAEQNRQEKGLHVINGCIPCATCTFVRRYSVVMLSGVVTTTGGRRKVTIRLTANSVTAANSISAETGRTFHAQAA